MRPRKDKEEGGSQPRWGIPGDDKEIGIYSRCAGE